MLLPKAGPVFSLESTQHLHGTVRLKIPLEADMDFLFSRAHQAILTLCGCVKAISQDHRIV